MNLKIHSELNNLRCVIFKYIIKCGIRNKILYFFIIDSPFFLPLSLVVTFLFNLMDPVCCHSHDQIQFHLFGVPPSDSYKDAKGFGRKYFTLLLPRMSPFFQIPTQ